MSIYLGCLPTYSFVSNQTYCFSLGIFSPESLISFYQSTWSWLKSQQWSADSTGLGLWQKFYDPQVFLLLVLSKSLGHFFIVYFSYIFTIIVCPLCFLIYSHRLYFGLSNLQISVSFCCFLGFIASFLLLCLVYTGYLVPCHFLFFPRIFKLPVHIVLLWLLSLHFVYLHNTLYPCSVDFLYVFSHYLSIIHEFNRNSLLLSVFWSSH